MCGIHPTTGMTITGALRSAETQLPYLSLLLGKASLRKPRFFRVQAGVPGPLARARHSRPFPGSGGRTGGRMRQRWLSSCPGSQGNWSGGRQQEAWRKRMSRSGHLHANNRCHSEFLALHRRPSQNVIPAHPQARKGRQNVLKNANAGVKTPLGPKSMDSLPLSETDPSPVRCGNQRMRFRAVLCEEGGQVHSTRLELNRWPSGSMGCGNPAVCSSLNLFVQNLTTVFASLVLCRCKQ